MFEKVTIVLLLLLIFYLWVSLRRSQKKAGQSAQKRSRGAVDGEQAAKAILASKGYRIVSAQHRAKSRFYVDRKAVEIEVRIDFIVEKSGQRFVAEVKTGQNAPNPNWPATRRQLLEYSLIFPDWPILLVDVPAEEIHLIEFDDWFV
ncbi:MAG: hypothetical protein ACON4U_03185 [Myxococcota bacterium]